MPLYTPKEDDDVSVQDAQKIGTGGAEKAKRTRTTTPQTQALSRLNAALRAHADAVAKSAKTRKAAEDASRAEANAINELAEAKKAFAGIIG